MNTTHAPIPTEYSGVRFRSKSEAIFARALELRGYPIWEYEPDAFCVDDWCPDFWAIAQNKKGHRIASLLIEYKPSAATEAYMENLAERFNELGSKKHRHLCVLACGNYFEEEFNTYILDGSKWIEMEEKIGLFRNIKEASRHRFDLA